MSKAETSRTVLGRGEAALDRSDFPEWVPAMLVKELRQGLRSNGFALMLSLLHLAMVLFFAFSVRLDVPDKTLELSDNFFWIFLSILLLGVTPIRGLQELHSEKQTRTLELLSAAGVSGTRLVVGKWSSLMVQSALVALTLAPYFVLRYFAGGVDLFYETRIVCLAVLASAVLTATALAMSGLKMMMRLLWAAKIVIVNFILMGVILSGALASGTLMKEVNAFGWEWLVLVFGASLASGVFLRLAGDLMDAPSANGAMVPRLGVVLGCGVLPFLSALGLNAGFQMMYAGMLCYLSTWVFIWHLHGQRPLLKVHLLPFRKLGAFLGRIAAFLLLPNWVGVSLLLFLPASGVLYLLWVASKPGKFEWVLVGIVLHVASYALCLIVLWRLFFATKRDSHGAVHERDPRLVLGWLMAISSLFAPISQISPLVPSMRLVGVFVPLLFTWAYSKSENLGVADVDVPDFLRITALSFSLYLLLSVWLGARWLQKNKTWQLFWSKAAVSDGPSADQSGAPPSTGPGA